jgi:hypothetical protein
MSGASPDYDEVNELFGGEGGVWRVTTRDSSHYFDLDLGTVTRVPGINALPTVYDRTRPLRTIDTLQVGHRGRWTMRNDGWEDLNEFYWANTSVVITIQRIGRGGLPDAGVTLPD